MALPSQYRLKNPRLLSAILQKGKSIRCPFFAVRFLPTLSGTAQVTVIISKKTEKLAVKRNKMRRRCLEAFLKVFKKLTEPCPFAIIIFPFESSQHTSVSILEENITDILLKIHCTKL